MDQYCNSDLVIPQSSEINPSSNGLFVTFKIPQTSFHDDNQNQSRRNLGGHPCHFCSKRFSSGKALGGHIRVHMIKPGGRVYKKKKKTPQSYLHSKLAAPAEEEEEEEQREVKLRSLGGGGEKGSSHSCCLCSKEFRSKKSLFGHMRNHPERGWRGIRPPHPPPPPPRGDGGDNNSCSSSTLSENELLQFHNTEKKRRIDHETASVHKDINEIPEAAFILMEMAHSGETLDLGKLVGNPSFVYNDEQEEEEEDDENEKEKLGQMEEKKIRKMETKQLDFDLNQPYVVDGDQGTLAHN